MLMLEHAYYSVISPEGCAAILWKNGERAAEAASALKLTSRDLERLGVVDEIVPEPLGGAHRAPDEMVAGLRERVLEAFELVDGFDTEQLLARRYERIRAYGSLGEPDAS